MNAIGSILGSMRIAVPSPPKPRYKPLKTAFRSKGFDYRQLRRTGDVALYEQTKSGLSSTWFEVVVVQRHEAYEIGGSKIDAAETMPSASKWGTCGFTYRDMKEAEKRFDELAKKAKEAR